MNQCSEFLVAADRATVQDCLRDASAAGQLVEVAAALGVGDVDRLERQPLSLEQGDRALALDAPAGDVEPDPRGLSHHHHNYTPIQPHCATVEDMENLPHPLPEDLVELGGGRQDVSKHPSVLAIGGILARRKDGNQAEQRLQTLALIVAGAPA